MFWSKRQDYDDFQAVLNSTVDLIYRVIGEYENAGPLNQKRLRQLDKFWNSVFAQLNQLSPYFNEQVVAMKKELTNGRGRDDLEVHTIPKKEIENRIALLKNIGKELENMKKGHTSKAI